MKIVKLDKNKQHLFVDLKDNEWLEKQREAGAIVAKTLVLLKNIVLNDSSFHKYTLQDLSSIGEKFIEDNNAIPTFKGYNGFPFGVCISVNENVVHGVPTETYLKEGDVVTFDLGATVGGAIADSAMTFIVGKPKCKSHVELVKITDECLHKGISAISVGKYLGVIGHAIQSHASKHKFALITEYGGHSLTWNRPHSDPFVSNASSPYEGIRMQEGLTLAIEPQLVDAKTSKTRILEDKWTVRAKGVSAHAEHTVYIHKDRVEIITDRSKYE